MIAHSTPNKGLKWLIANDQANSSTRQPPLDEFATLLHASNDRVGNLSRAKREWPSEEIPRCHLWQPVPACLGAARNEHQVVCSHRRDHDCQKEQQKHSTKSERRRITG